MGGMITNYLYKFKKGDSFYFKTEASVSVGAWNADKTKARSRLQVSYEGPNKKVYSGYCPSNGGKKWRTYCLKKTLRNSLGDEYIHVSNGGTVKILKQGIYKIRLQVIQHRKGSQYTRMRIMKNGKRFDYA